MVQNLLVKAAIGALGLAYLDAKHFVSYDLHSIKAVVRGRKQYVSLAAKYKSLTMKQHGEQGSCRSAKQFLQF